MSPTVIIVTVLVAILAGLVVGALGGGGAVLTFPALVYLLHQPPDAATTGALVVVMISSTVAMFTHRRGGRVHAKTGLIFGIVGAAGAALGTKLNAAVDGLVLLACFAVLLLISATLMLRSALKRGNTTRKPGTDANPAEAGYGSEQTAYIAQEPKEATNPEETKPAKPTSWFVIGASATLVGLLTGFLGVGGGFIIVPVLTLILGMGMRTAVGTSLLVISLNSAVALATRVFVPSTQPDWAIIAVFTAVSVLASLAGTRIVSLVSANTLRIAFATMLILVAIYTAIRVVLSL